MPAGQPMSGRKKGRSTPPDPEYILEVGREIMNRRGQGSSFTEERRFREHFGCAPPVAAKIWELINPELTVPGDATVAHMMWSLMFLKMYSKEGTISGIAGGVDEKTYRKWVWLFVFAIAELESSVVSFWIMKAWAPVIACYFMH